MFGIGFERLRLVIVPDGHVQPKPLAPERDDLRQGLSGGLGAGRVVVVERMYHERIVSPREDVVLRSLLGREDDGHRIAILRRSIAREADVDLMPYPVGFDVPRDTEQAVVVLRDALVFAGVGCLREDRTHGNRCCSTPFRHTVIQLPA